jgi:hypothetical protein
VIAISAASASLLVVTQSLEIDSFVAALGFAFTLALALAASVLALRSKPPRIIFHLLLVACLVNVILLMLG